MNFVAKMHSPKALVAPILLTAGLYGGQSMAHEDPDRVVKQDEGKIVYWVPPGPRQLSKEVFGTPNDPKMLFEPKLKAAEEAVAAKKMPPAVPDTLKKVPLLVGIPMKARSTDKDGKWWFNHPNPFPDKGLIIEGSFTARFWDEVKEDPAGPPGKTPDKAEVEATFTDPDGNTYRVVLDHIVKPPFPGYETQGGVLLDGFHHGSTGTGSPLMPQVWTIAGLWGIAELYINGELVEPNRVIHLMTTEVVRDKDYHLALQEELPLPPERWHVKGQSHHTHLVVLPFVGVPGKGPVFKPTPVEFELPNGKRQPFMHIMYEQDEIAY